MTRTLQKMVMSPGMIRESVKMSGASEKKKRRKKKRQRKRKKAEQIMTEKEGGKSLHVSGFGSLSKDLSSS